MAGNAATAGNTELVARAERPVRARAAADGRAAGLHVEQDEISAGVADITGNVVARISVNPSDAEDPVALVRGAVLAACSSAGVPPARRAGWKLLDTFAEV